MVNADPQLLLVGNSSWLNRGCEAIERGVRALASDAMPGVHFVVAPFASGDPLEAVDVPGVTRLAPIDFRTSSLSLERVRRSAHRRFGVPVHHRTVSAPYRVLDSHIRDSNALVQIGGDNFSLDYGKPDRFFALNDRAIRSGCPVVLWGATVGPFSADPSYEEYAAGQLSRIDLILCRDHDSVEYLRRIGVTENVSFAMDPAFVLSSDASASQAVADFASGAVALNISPLYARYAGVSIEELAARACGLVRGICADTGRRVLLVPHVVLPTQDDHSFAVTVLSELRDLGDKVAVAPRDFSAGQLKWCVSRCAAIIAARTHLTIAGFSSSVPTISLGYSAKAAAINRDVYGHDRWVIAADAFTVQTVASLLMQLLDEADDVRRVLSAKQQDFAASAASAAQDVASLVSRTGAGAVRT